MILAARVARTALAASLFPLAMALVLAGASVSADGPAIAVSNPLAIMDVTPGRSYTHTLTVSNPTNVIEDVVVEARGLGQGLDGAFQPLPRADDVSPRSAQSFVSQIDRPSFSLGPRASQTVTSTITVPPTLGAGSFYASLYVYVKGESGSSSASIGSQSAILVPVVLTSSGSLLTEIGAITDLALSPIGTGQPLQALTTVQNVGNRHFKAMNQVTLFDQAGTAITSADSTLTFSSIVPKYAYQFQLSLLSAGQVKSLAPGSYRVESKVVSTSGAVLDVKNFDFTIGEASPSPTPTVTPETSPTITPAPNPVPDTIAPVSTAAFSPAAASGGWNNGDVTVSISATDDAGGSGVKEIHWSVDAGTEAVVAGDSAVFTLSEGIHAVSYYAVDGAGNVELPKTLPVRVDETAPTISWSASAGTDGRYYAPLAVHFSCSDELSGVASCPEDRVFSAGNGQSISVLATDKAGNTGGVTVGPIDVLKSPQAIRFGPLPQKSYGDPPFDVTATGGGSGNPIAFGAGPANVCTIDGSTVTLGGAGDCVLTASQAGSPDYEAGFAAVGLGIRKAALVVAAGDASKIYGAPNPEFTASYTGFVGTTDTPSSLTGTLTLSTTAATDSPVGSYAIVPSGLSSPDYSIEFVNGTLSVIYLFGGFNQPVVTPIQTFELGSTIPIKVELALWGEQGYVSTARIRLAVYKLNASGTYPVTDDVLPVGTDDIFTCDGRQYTYNLRTGAIPTGPGSYRLEAQIDDGTTQYVDVALR